MDTKRISSPETEQNGDLTEMTIRISAEEDAAAVRRVSALQTVALSDHEEPDPGETSLLRLTSTQLLNYFAGRKKNRVNDIIDEKELQQKLLEDPVDFSEEDQNLQPVDVCYDFCDYLAEGGQGVLRTAKDRALHRRVVVKSLKKELLDNHSTRDSFLKEARVTASLDHPAIVPVYGLHTDENHGLHLAMKLLHGKSLKVYFNQVLRCYRDRGVSLFDEEDAMLYRLDIFLRICDAMSYVHSRGVLHCDLKPENIILGEFRDVYLMDWGIARKLDENGQSPPQKQIMGTPRYTSPENLLNLPCDVRSDVYTLGVILFEMITLRAAFSSRTVQGVVNAVKVHAFAPLRHRFGCHISKDLACIVRKATAFHPDRRYQTVAELTDDLRRYLRGAEVSANPDGFFGKMVRWSTRHKKLFFSLISLMVLLGIGTGVIGVFLNLARTAIEERVRDNIKNSAYAAAFQISDRVDRQFTHIAYLLSLLNSDIALLLSLPPSEKVSMDAFVAANEFQEHQKYCSAGVAVPYRNNPEDLAHAIVFPPPGGALDMHSVRQLNPLLNRLQATVLCSLFLNKEGKISDAARKSFADGSGQIWSAYFTLHNGTSFFYPGTNDLPTDYDGRSRPWFKSVRDKQGDSVWSEPYADAGEQQQKIVTCSAEIINPDGVSFGVAALDVPLTAVSRLMRGNRNDLRFAVERVLLNSRGKVILSWNHWSIDAAETPNSQGDGTLPDFRSPELFLRMKRMKYGSFLKKEPQGTSLYVFCTIPSVGYLYVERHDFTRLLQEKLMESSAKKQQEFFQSGKTESGEKQEGK